MVHIRAVPEGGFSGATGGVPIATNLPFTFYDRYTPDGARTADRRQPLPSAWAVRYIQGGVSGFASDFKIWREGVTAGPLNCSAGGAQFDGFVLVGDMVRFDEHENSYGNAITNCVSACIPPVYTLPVTSRTSSTSSLFPTLLGTDVGGWMYLNLSNGGVVRRY